MFKKLFLLPLLVLDCCICPGSAPEIAWLDGIKHTYGWQRTVDPAAGGQAFSELKASDPASQLFSLMQQRRQCTDAAGKLRLNSQLAILQKQLLEQLKLRADLHDTFALAELLASPLAPRQDVALAAVLYKYCADRGFTPGIFQLGRILAFYEAFRNPPAAEQLLRKAAADKLNAAYLALHELYIMHNQPEAAAKARKLAEEFYEFPGDLFFAARRPFTELPENWTEKITALQQYLTHYPEYCALPLGQLYYRQPQRNWPMAINCALLSERYLTDSSAARQLLEKIDLEYGMTLFMYALWQSHLQCATDLQTAIIDAELLITGYRRDPSAAAARRVAAELKNLLQAAPEKVLLSGLLLRLNEYDFPAAVLLELLPDDLPGSLTGAILSLRTGDEKLQKLWSGKLLRQVAKLQLATSALDLRKELMPLIPGVALLGKKGPPDPEYFSVLWNTAILIHSYVLKTTSSPAAAAAFQQRYPRHKLPEKLQLYEQNFIKIQLKNAL